MNIAIRVNGTGNAWPTFIGEQHPFYWDGQPESMANASFSVFGWEGKSFGNESIKWSLLIDAGHGAVQQIIKNENRIPEAILLTHHHLDHTLGIDWVIQSYSYKHNKKKKYPVYASSLCWEQTVSAYPGLKDIVEFTELEPGKSIEIKQVPGANLTGYPVYHGSRAYGAMMLVIETENRKKIVFTGDCLCPLLRKKDIENITGPDFLFVDSNNRFPYPLSNHFSISRFYPEGNHENFLKKWLQQITLQDLLVPHKSASKELDKEYFREFQKENQELNGLCFSVLDFIQLIKPLKTGLVHYGGIEDEKYYREKKLTKRELEAWILRNTCNEKIKSKIILPSSGEFYK
ncbi:MAG: MBL fold metallo-hydrolase [Bacteroidales bacterium]|nr:MBL fold metallo-hydrolase [Bacteroidales bacterium]